MKWTRLSMVLIAGIAGALLLVACGADPTPTPTPPPPPTATPTPVPVAQPTEAPAPDPTATPTPDAMAAIEAEKAELIAAAQEEGELQAFFCCDLGDGTADHIQGFEDEFRIRVVFSGGSSREQAPKVLAEREAGQYTLDVWSGGLNPAIPTLIPAGVLQPLKPLLFFPEVLDESGWYDNRLHWFDQPGNEYVVGWNGSGSTAGIAYNTDLVDPMEIQSFWDLLDPKWKGKIIARDPREVGSSGTTAFYYMNEQMGAEWLQRMMTEMDITLTSNARQAAEQLALGKFHLCMWACGREVRALEREGQPVDDVFPHILEEGASISPGGGAFYVLDRPPNPNAQKLFVNWFLSREGQIFAQKASGSQSLRTDIPLDGVNEASIRNPDVDYFILGSQTDYQEQLESALTVVRDALASVGK